MLYQVIGTWIYSWFYEGKGTLGKVGPVIYYVPDELRIVELIMGDSIRDSILTPYIRNLLGKIRTDVFFCVRGVWQKNSHIGRPITHNKVVCIRGLKHLYLTSPDTNFRSNSGWVVAPL
jgi:hypothetical protein